MDSRKLKLERLGRLACMIVLLGGVAACGSRQPAPVVDRSTITARAAEAARTPASRPAPPRPREAAPTPPARPPAAVAEALPARSVTASNVRNGPAESAGTEAPLIRIEPVQSDNAPAARPAPESRRPSPAPAQKPPAPVQSAAAPVQPPAAPVAPPPPPSVPPATPQGAKPPVSSVSTEATAPRSAQGTAVAPGAPSSSSTERFIWPVPGRVLEAFSEAQNPALFLDGRLGDPVNAAADGRVIFSGQGPKGYGNLLIVKHDDHLLSVYGHNDALLVKEGEQVRQGQAIARLGSSDSDRPRLRFEIRRDGRPVDPTRMLPAR
ncbi:MAG: hypothetical protein RL322_695 [Pseudomonadota bacterium]